MYTCVTVCPAGVKEASWSTYDEAVEVPGCRDRQPCRNKGLPGQGHRSSAQVPNLGSVFLPSKHAILSRLLPGLPTMYESTPAQGGLIFFAFVHPALAEHTVSAVRLYGDALFHHNMLIHTSCSPV